MASEEAAAWALFMNQAEGEFQLGETGAGAETLKAVSLESRLTVEAQMVHKGQSQSMQPSTAVVL